MSPIRFPSLAALAFVFVACDGRVPDRTPAAASASASASSASATAVARSGDVSVRASVVQTSILDPAVARGYGIVRDPNTVLLLVAVRKGDDASASALPARITATATDLRGGKQAIAMRELRSGELLDYVGTVTTTLPDTLRFEVTAVREDGATSMLQLTRDFYPQ